jgi:D-alanine transaminase|tara:strand:+ start:9429 stop:10280 length:852 start_codon:yes stop_codon:yes gene_type:complete
MDDIIFLNGDFISKSNAQISVMDRGFLFGDGVYELIPIYNGKIFLIDKHLSRLKNSLKLINMKSDFTEIVNIKGTIEHLIQTNNYKNIFIYIHITRGIQNQRQHIYPSEIKPTVLIMGEQYPSFTMEQIARGFKACIQNDYRWAKSNIKSISLLGNVLLKNLAAEQGMFETILMKNNKLTEGSASNVFIVKNKIIQTPKLSNELLPGVTRGLIIGLLQDKNFQIKECDISVDDVKNADEVWCSSSTNEVVPIVNIDDNQINDGSVGDMTLKTYKLVQDFINNY